MFVLKILFCVVRMLLLRRAVRNIFPGVAVIDSSKAGIEAIMIPKSSVLIEGKLQDMSERAGF